MLAVLVAGAVLGVLGLARVPVTHAYIYAHGTEAEARIEGEWVAFVADDGGEYTLQNTFSSRSTYPAGAPILGHDHDASPFAISQTIRRRSSFVVENLS
ncbi:hypothetical protein RERY_24050 [Rhodococcus erythropolis]|nr:hypothetical protein RERY_24050 [Rhodococcus erythropolis]